MKKNTEIDKVICKYIFKDDYNPKYVNGAQGGFSPQGEFVINFYCERNAIPVSQTYPVKDGKLAGNELSHMPVDLNSSFVRVIENGVMMNYRTAKEVHNWLGILIEQMEANKNE
jgi:hypothetical protein